MASPPAIYVYGAKNGSQGKRAIDPFHSSSYYFNGPNNLNIQSPYDLSLKCLNVVSPAKNKDISNFDPSTRMILWEDILETEVETSYRILELYIVNQGGNVLNDAKFSIFSYDVGDLDSDASLQGPNIQPPKTSSTTNIFNNIGDHLASNQWCKASLNRGTRLSQGEAESDVFVYHNSDTTTSQNETDYKWIAIGGSANYIKLRPTAYFGAVDEETGELITEFDDMFYVLKGGGSKGDISKNSEGKYTSNSEAVSNVSIVFDPPNGATPGWYWFVPTVMGWYT